VIVDLFEGEKRLYDEVFIFEEYVLQAGKILREKLTLR
jgi:hypothetical protein